MKQTRYVIGILLMVLMAFQAIAFEQETTTQDRYIAGGVVGTVIGLGIGQAINGNYTNSGWVFTLTEAPSLGMLIAGAMIYRMGAPYLTYDQAYNLGIGLLIPGVLLFAGFRIWDIVDLWSMPYVGKPLKDPDATKQKPKRYSLKLFDDGEVYGLSFRF